MANNTSIISSEVLIPLVEQRSVIWDKTLDKYKDKGLKLAAWREICRAFDSNFDTWEEKERKDFAKKISTKWTNIRDAYMRCLKKEKDEKRSGAGAKTARPYVYKNQLSFLLKINEHRKPQHSYNEPNNSTSDTHSDAAIDDQLPPQKKTKTNTLDDKMSQFLGNKLRKLDSQEHPHVSFIKGALPSLALFDDDDNLEFQMGVLALIQKIKKKRRNNLLYDTHARHFSGYENHFIERRNSNCDSGASTSTGNTSIICDDQVVKPSASPTLSNYTNMSSNTQNSFDFTDVYITP